MGNWVLSWYGWAVRCGGFWGSRLAHLGEFCWQWGRGWIGIQLTAFWVESIHLELSSSESSVVLKQQKMPKTPAILLFPLLEVGPKLDSFLILSSSWAHSPEASGSILSCTASSMSQNSSPVASSDITMLQRARGGHCQKYCAVMW